MKNITKFIFMAFVAAWALMACSPNDNFSLGSSNITQDAFTFTGTSGSDEWTYNFAVAFTTAPTSVYSTEIVFGDGKSTKGALTATHEYIALAGSVFTPTCIVTIPDGTTFIKTLPTITVNNDNPKALVDDPASLQYALTGGKANTAGKKWYIGGWTAMRNPDNHDEVWWNFNGPDPAMMNDVMTFTPNGIETNGGYIYDNNGDTFMNQALNALFGGTDPDNSFIATTYVAPTDATWEITQESGVTVLNIHKGFVSYPTAPADIDGTKYEVLSYSPSNIRLSLMDGWGAWCFEQVTTAASDDNLWSGVTFTNTFYYAYSDSWTQLPDPALTINGATYSLSFPNATSYQWQNQIVFVTDNLATTADKNYDFSVTMNASNDIKQVTVKLTQNDDDNTFIFTNRIDLTAGQDVTLDLKNMPGQNMPRVKLVFDFGGNPANTDVVIKNIVLREHTN